MYEYIYHNSNADQISGDKEFLLFLFLSVLLIIVSLWNLAIAVLIPNVMVFGDRAFKKAFMVKWGHKGRTLIPGTSVLSRRGRGTKDLLLHTCTDNRLCEDTAKNGHL